MNSPKLKSAEEYLASKPKAKGTSRASNPRKSATRSKSSPKAGGKPDASEAKPIKVQKGAVVLLSGGNPQIAKTDGDAPVPVYIAAMPG
jgi:hypothetical protein